MKDGIKKIITSIKGFFTTAVNRLRNIARKKTQTSEADKPQQNTPDTAKKQRKPWSKKRKIIFFGVIGFIVLLTAAGSVYAYSILHSPMDQFDTIAKQAEQTTDAPPQTEEPAPQATEPGPTPTLDPYEQLLADSDFSILDNYVNIMLIGVDHADERDTWSGKHAFHSDVMIVLCINKDTGKVSLISLPRDTYANIPDIYGIYKLNASIDCGGGWPTEDGFNKVCEAAEWMLGGIPVNYYYAVDMGAVKGLVDAIDGVDYDIEVAFKIQGRSYKTGMQHMDGQAVLDYLRVRKKLPSGHSGDLRRIDRQKRMLVAIFEKIKSQGLLTSIPDLLSAFDGNMYTNTTFGQTAALAAYAFDVNSEDIAMYSMGGIYDNIFNWNFVLTDQDNRVDIIKEVYGFDRPRYEDYTASAARSRWAGMQKPTVISKSGNVLSQVKAILDADSLLPPYPNAAPASWISTTNTTPLPSSTTTPSPSSTTTPSPTSTTTPEPSPTASPSPSPSASPTPSPSPTASPTPSPSPTASPKPTPTPDPDDYRKYGDAEWNLYNSVVSQRQTVISSGSFSAIEQLKADIGKLCSMFGIKVPSWRVNYESSMNEILVDFR